MKKTNEQVAMRVTLNCIIGNFILTAFKLFAGFVSGSAAMVSDAVHSASDLFSSVIVIIAIKMSGKESDKDHQYGHERFECVAAILLSVILFATGLAIGAAGFRALNNDDAPAPPGMIALFAAILSIISKEAMYWYARNAAKKTNSGALMADAWHHRSDALSSVGSLIGISGAMLGYPLLDPLACVVITFFILKASVDIFIDAIGKMTDKAVSDDMYNKIHALVLAQDNVAGIDSLKTRIFGNEIYVDIDITAAGDITLKEAHIIADNVHDSVEREIANVKHCMVHVSPV